MQFQNLKLNESPSLRATVILGSIIIFIIFKFNDIFLPYFWDEMAGYMSGIIYMQDHGISLHPSAIPAEMSYGHPLLMHMIMASIGKIFGNTVAIMHITTLVFTLVLAYGTYLLSFQLVPNRQVAIFAFILFLVQPIVLAQSTQVLLEVFLALHTVYSIYFYMRKKYLFSLLFCCMAVMTKETGLVLAIAIPVYIVMEMLMDKKSYFLRLSVFLIPFIVFAIFLYVQHKTYGWYLNPVNVGKSKLAFDSMIQKIWDYPLEFTFVNQGRFIYTVVLISAILFSYYRKEKPLFLPTYFFVLVFCFGFILFSSVADTLERYFLVLIPFAVILFSAAINKFEVLHKLVPFSLLISGLTCNLLFFDNGLKYADADLSYRQMVKTNQMVFDYVNSGKFEKDTVSFYFPMLYAPVDPRFGYFKELHFVADTGVNTTSAYRVYCKPGNMDWNPPDTNVYRIYKEFSAGFSGSFIYKRIKN